MAGLHPEEAYLVHSAVELGELVPTEAMVFQLADFPQQELRARCLANQPVPATWMRSCARSYLAKQSVEVQRAWALLAIKDAPFMVQSFHERVTHMVQVRVQEDLGIRKRSSFSIGTDGNSLVPVKRRRKLFPTVHDITCDKVQAFADQFRDARDLILADLQRMDEALAWYRQRPNQARATVQALLAQFAVALPNNLLLRDVANQVGHLRQERKRARGAIKKVLRLFSRLFGT